MASLSSLQLSIFTRVSDIAARLNARWLKHCRPHRPLRITKVSLCNPYFLARYEYYGKLRGVMYIDFAQAFSEPHRAGPLAPDASLPKWLERALVTYCTCADLIIAFWTSLETKMSNMLYIVRVSWLERSDVKLSFLYEIGTSSAWRRSAVMCGSSRR
jgi:hypothetical protein